MSPKWLRATNMEIMNDKTHLEREKIIEWQP